ncbi:MAG: iron chelate uptake ABC transporter family permease subunit [Pseudomonadota bacterium]
MSVTTYMTVGARGNWEFLLSFRGTKLAAIVLIAISVSTSTVLFQTVARNRILTPSIMGFDALYVLMFTLGVFFMGAHSFLTIAPVTQYFVSLLLMVGVALALFGTLLLQAREDIMRMMLTGVILAAFFRSLTSLITRIIDPNEFGYIQVASFARFNQIDADLLSISAVLCGVCLLIAWRIRHRLDVLALGREAAINLGENPRRGVIEVLILVAVLVSVSTAFVGPIAFLGLLVVSIAHRVWPTASHGVLLPVAAAVSIITLVGGQAILERVLHSAVPLIVIVDFLGGILFLYLILMRSHR